MNGALKSGLHIQLVYSMGIAALGWTGWIQQEQGLWALIVWHLCCGLVSVYWLLKCNGMTKPELSIKITSWAGRLIALAMSLGAIYLLLLYKAIIFGFQIFQIPSASMVPTLRVSDWIMTDTRPWVLTRFQRDEVIVFERPNAQPDVYYIKRIVAISGDMLKIEQNRMWVNGQPVKTSIEGKKLDMHEVSEGHFFVLGDNTGQSLDSRHFGEVPYGMVSAKYSYRLFE